MSKVRYLQQPFICHQNMEYWLAEWESAKEECQTQLKMPLYDERAQGMYAQSAKRRDLALRSYLDCQNCKIAEVWS